MSRKTKHLIWDTIVIGIIAATIIAMIYCRYKGYL